MKYYVYILYSATGDRYYVGHTYHLEERIDEHNSGKTPSTRAGRPWICVYTEEYPDKSSASRRENAIKSKKSRKYIEELIESKG